MKAELEKIGMKNDGISRRIDLLDDSLRTSTDDLQQKLETLLAAFREAQDVVTEKRILQALVFTDMDARFISIHQAERDTFGWIFNNPHGLLKNEPDLTISFADWLKSGSGIFHIVGKPGAGKSALMKYLCEQDETKDFLEEWATASGRELIFCKFFFWRITPVAEQKTLRGLIRGLLHGVLTQVPSLSRRLFPKLWDSKKGASRWGWVELGDRDVSNAFESLMSDTAIFDDFRLCFFIDGLDEFEQSIALQSDTHASLAAKLQQWTSNSGGCVKICVSSRPLLEFVKSFPASQRLTLQKLTENDIRTLVTHRLQSNGLFAELRGRSEDECRRCDQLLEKILREAEGVFLWVVLVLSELEQALANSDSLEVLEKIVATSHKDIKDFVRSILMSIPSRHRHGSYYLLAVFLRMLGMFTSETEATANLRATLEGTFEMYQGQSVHYISLAECAMFFDAADRGNLLDCDKNSAEITLNLEERSEAVAKETDRLLARCRGLVEVDPQMDIRFTHRAIPEALQDLFFSNALGEPIQDKGVTEILAWIVLADVRLQRHEGSRPHIGNVEWNSMPIMRLKYVALTHFRIYTVPLENSERMMILLFNIHEALLLIQYDTATPNDDLWHELSWPGDTDAVGQQCLALGVFDYFQLHEFLGWLIDNKLSPKRDKNRLLGYLRLIVILVGGDLPWISSTALETVLSKMLQRGLTLDAEHPPGFVHSTKCPGPECRLWHEFLFKDLVRGMTHKCLKNFIGYREKFCEPFPINWKGLEVLLRFGPDPDIYFSAGQTPHKAALLGATGEILFSEDPHDRLTPVHELVKVSLAETVKLHKPPNMGELLALIERNMEEKTKRSAQVTMFEGEQHGSGVPGDPQAESPPLTEPVFGEAGQKFIGEWVGTQSFKIFAYLSLAAWLTTVWALLVWFWLEG